MHHGVSCETASDTGQADATPAVVGVVWEGGDGPKAPPLTDCSLLFSHGLTGWSAAVRRPPRGAPPPPSCGVVVHRSPPLRGSGARRGQRRRRRPATRKAPSPRSNDVAPLEVRDAPVAECPAVQRSSKTRAARAGTTWGVERRARAHARGRWRSAELATQGRPRIAGRGDAEKSLEGGGRPFRGGFGWPCQVTLPRRWQRSR